MRRLLLTLACLAVAADVCAQRVVVNDNPQHIICDSGCASGGAVDQGTGGASPWLVKFDGTGSNNHIVCDSGCGSPPASADGTAFVAGTTNVSLIGAAFNDALADVTSGTYAAPRITAKRGLHVNLRTNAGVEVPFPAALGQTTMAASWPVTLASNQSALGVTGTFWQNTQPVSGTFWQVTQPVSGTFWQVTQPVSGTFWQATQPISATALPLPAGAATSAIQTDRTQKSQITDGTRDGTVKAASTAAVAADTSLVVALSPNSGIKYATVDSAFVRWTNATALNTVTALSIAGGASATITIGVFPAITGGVLSFESSVDVGANWYPFTCRTLETVSTYESGTSTNPVSGYFKVWQCRTADITDLRVKLTTVLTGAGFVDVTINGSSAPTSDAVLIAGPKGATNESPITSTAQGTDHQAIDVQEYFGGVAIDPRVLQAGTALIGKVGIDQTTPGTTNGVQVTAALPAGTNRIGSVRPVDSADADLTSAKATQTSRAVGTQDLKDAGRTAISFYANNFASGTTTTETIITWNQSKGTAAVTGSTASYTITNGKTLRITGLSVGSRGNATATIQSTVFNLRLNTGGACIVSSTPILFAAQSATAAVASAWDRVIIPIPDGYEIAGNGTIAICISAAATFTTNAPTWAVNLVGYEY